jgi:hypothetical protein
MNRSTKLKQFSKQVKEIIYERDVIDGVPCCIFCGTYQNLSVAHFVGKAQQGLGIQENGFLACIAGKNCHHEFDNGKSKERKQQMRIHAEEHLRSKYQFWDENMLRQKNKWSPAVNIPRNMRRN